MIMMLGWIWLFGQLLGLVTLGRRWDERRGARTPTHPDAYPTRVGLALDRAEDRCQSAHHERGRRRGLEPRYPSRYHRPLGTRGSNPS